MKRVENITDYEKHKKINKLTKPRSPIVIEFMTNDLPDEWLIDVVRYKRSSGEVVETFFITGVEIETWVNKYKKDGYSLTQS